MVKKDFIFAVICCISLLFLGCKSAEHTDVGNIRQSSTFIIGELEASIDDFDRGVGRAVERSKSIEDEVARLDYLFGEYEQAALRLREDLIKTKAELEKLQNIYDNSDSSSVVNDSSSSGNDNLKD